VSKTSIRFAADASIVIFVKKRLEINAKHSNFNSGSGQLLKQEND
jgi:hypothetical protein